MTIGDRGRFVEVGKRIVACSQMTEEERALELAQIEIVEHPPKFVASVGILLGALGRIVPVHYSGPKGHNSCWTIDPVDVPAVNAVGGVA